MDMCHLLESYENKEAPELVRTRASAAGPAALPLSLDETSARSRLPKKASCG
jgi:hypothetical protein